MNIIRTGPPGAGAIDRPAGDLVPVLMQVVLVLMEMEMEMEAQTQETRCG